MRALETSHSGIVEACEDLGALEVQNGSSCGVFLGFVGRRDKGRRAREGGGRALYTTNANFNCLLAHVYWLRETAVNSSVIVRRIARGELYILC